MLITWNTSLMLKKQNRNESEADNGTLKGGRPSLCTLCLSSLNPQSNPMRYALLFVHVLHLSKLSKDREKLSRSNFKSKKREDQL